MVDNFIGDNLPLTIGRPYYYSSPIHLQGVVSTMDYADPPATVAKNADRLNLVLNA